MKRRCASVSAIFVLLVAMLLISAQTESHAGVRDDSQMIYYFYESVCGSCDEEGEFYAELSEQLGGRSLPEGWSVRCVNVFREGDDLYRRVCEERGVPREEMGLPMLLASAGAIVGEEAISAGMRELIHDSCGVLETVWYYQRPDCRDCQAVSGIIREAAASRPQYFFIEVDTTDEEAKETFKELLRELGIPQEEWEVPFLYNGDIWLSGCEDIEGRLQEIFSDD